MQKQEGVFYHQGRVWKFIYGISKSFYFMLKNGTKTSKAASFYQFFGKSKN